MMIKFPKQLKLGDYIIHDYKKYRVNSYNQCIGMGHFQWGEYGILEVNEVLIKQLWQNKDKSATWENGENLLTTRTELMTYENYPFIVQ